MEKLDNNFEERLRKYSEHIKSMKIVYHEGRVKCINNKESVNFKSRTIQDEHTNIKSCDNEDDIIISNEEYYIIKNKYLLILKFIFVCIIFISMLFMYSRFADMGLNEFISGIGSILISYFIINIICIFFK